MMQNQDKYFTDLDIELQHLAALDWPLFVNLVGEDAIKAAKVCLLKKRGKSLLQISNRFGRSKGWAQRINNITCKACA